MVNLGKIGNIILKISIYEYGKDRNHHTQSKAAAQD